MDFAQRAPPNKPKRELTKPCPISNNKIRRFIEKQKRRFKAKKDLEETIEYDKSLRVKQTLMELQNFARTGDRGTK